MIKADIVETLRYRSQHFRKPPMGHQADG